MPQGGKTSAGEHPSPYKQSALLSYALSGERSHQQCPKFFPASPNVHTPLWGIAAFITRTIAIRYASLTLLDQMATFAYSAWITATAVSDRTYSLTYPGD